MRIGVYVCHGGLNIASILDVEALKEFAEKLPDVAVARDLPFPVLTQVRTPSRRI